MKTLICVFPLLSLLSGVSAAAGCGPCDPDQCAPLPADGCPAGTLMDSCSCCSVCAAAEGELCGGRRTAARRCGPGLECLKSNEDKKNKLGVCTCKSNYEVCGSDGVTYKTGCALKRASLTAGTEGNPPITVQNKGRCAAGEKEISVIVTPPGEVYNVSGSQVYLSCEAVGVPTNSARTTKHTPSGDRDNLAIQTRGGPEKHEVTGWVLISPLTKEEEGEASAIGTIHLVESLDASLSRKVTIEI
uniref:Insulin-like growth factor binding protein 7 n=1 Tax=Labrus bergylta TaxID=56723 RepID=A0A3Q3EE47_9LABR